MTLSHGAAQMARPQVDQDRLMEELPTGKGRAEFLEAVERHLEEQAEQFKEAEQRCSTDGMWAFLSKALREAALSTFPSRSRAEAPEYLQHRTQRETLLEQRRQFRDQIQSADVEQEADARFEFARASLRCEKVRGKTFQQRKDRLFDEVRTS